MPPLPARPIMLMLAMALLAGCHDRHDAAKQADSDPEMAAALRDPIMADPDLSGPNRRGAALTGGGVPAITLPLDDAGDDVAAAARAEALSLAGGSLKAVPAPSGDGMPMPGEAAMLTARRVFGRGDACLGKVDYTTAWAARMPEPFALYPRGHTQEAAGTDQGGCRLRVVNFRVPVAVGDVLGFYYTRARQAGFSAAHRASGDAHLLSGAKGAVRYFVLVRPGNADAGDAGPSEVDLITEG